ncbi:hypothetical protein ScalyP_jg4211 [Parmales sp. scaly parma]|nr:hypothetical protein ScalyP_jg4211 [Parmales sp. scaly parma]
MNPCHPKTNPAGLIALCVAENKLPKGRNLFSARLQTAAATGSTFLDSTSFEYNSMTGLESLRTAVASIFANHFLPPKINFVISPDNIICASGGSSILNSLFSLLCSPRTAVLIPAPYYAAFENDMKVLAGCVPVPVRISGDPRLGPTAIDLDAARDSARSQGMEVGMVLVTNPHNPLGIVYEHASISSIVGWARNQPQLTHVVVDEIYALSQFSSSDTEVGAGKFVSAIKVLNNELNDDVHVIWGMSKDFGASGFRMGFLYTMNEELKQAFGNINAFSAVSHPIQSLVAIVLSDSSFVSKYLSTMRAELLTSYTIAAKTLTSLSVPFTPACSGVFVYADFSKFLPDDSWEGEEALVQMFFNEGVVMTPGKSQQAAKPGFFRICYAWVDVVVLEIAMGRIRTVADNLNLNGWVDLDSET